MERLFRWFRDRTESIPAVGQLAEALYVALYDPLERPGVAPFVRDAISTKRYMFTVVAALIPVLMAAVWYYGPRPLLLVVIAYGVGGFIEGFFAWLRDEPINEGFLVSGMLFALVFPPDVPLWVFMTAVVLGEIFGKELFGGVGRNIFNPVLTGRVLVFLSWPALVAPAVYPSPADAVSVATYLASGAVHQSIWTMFAGPKPGCIGEISPALVYAGGIFIALMRISDWRIPLGVLAGAAFTAWAASFLSVGARPIWFHLLSGGLPLAAFFMATDPVTSPRYAWTKLVYGLFIGFLVILIRQWAPLPEGAMFSVLLGNAFAPLLDEIALAFRKKTV